MKRGISFIISAFVLLSLSSISAINLEIQKTPVSDVVISEINEPAIFNFQIKNLGQQDFFEIYSLVGVDFSPKGTFEILGLENKEIVVMAYPEKRLRENPGYLNFAYKIKGQNTGIKEDMLTLNIVNFKDAILINTENIAPDYTTAVINVQNRVKHNFEGITAEFKSSFFETEEEFSLGSLETKKFNVTLNKAKMRGLVAGKYILTGSFQIGNFEKDLEGTIKYIEKSGISVSEDSSGFIIRKKEVAKTNEGNIPTVAEININKNIISRLFSQFSSEPTRTDRRWFIVHYYWSKELKPGESLDVAVKTNYLYPLLILAAIILIAYLSFLYTSSSLSLRKRVNFVRTKGGEFALKVTINVSARKYVEKISITDRLPGIVKIHERFGTYPPDRIDEARRRLEWNIERLHPGEERVFSYIIYSKMAIVGRFELPVAVAVFERDGKTQETNSNKAFFMNEQRDRED